MKITNQKFQTFYPNQYSPEEQAALDDLRKTVAERGGVGPWRTGPSRPTEQNAGLRPAVEPL